MELEKISEIMEVRDKIKDIEEAEIYEKIFNQINKIYEDVTGETLPTPRFEDKIEVCATLIYGLDESLDEIIKMR